MHTDVAKDADIENLRDEALATMGHVDIVMSNAGVAMIGPPEGLSMKEWDWILQINLYGVIRNVRAFLPHLIERGSGYVVNTASVAGLYAYSWDHPTYITAKFGRRRVHRVARAVPEAARHRRLGALPVADRHEHGRHRALRRSR